MATIPDQATPQVLTHRPPDAQLASAAGSPPTGADWLHDFKLDGYRLFATKIGADVRLTSRHGTDWTRRLPQIARAVANLPCTSATLDGELIAHSGSQRDFAALQLTVIGRANAPLSLMAFDLLHLDGHDLRDCRLIDRKALLVSGLVTPMRGLGFVSHIIGHGDEAFAFAGEHQLEGIVSKRLASRYRAGRSGDWLKIKYPELGRFAVVGFIPTRRAVHGLGALILAQPGIGGAWHFAGTVSSGITAAHRQAVFGCVGDIAQSPEGIEGAPELRGAAWCSPCAVVEVKFRGLDVRGWLRQTSIASVVLDISPEQLVAAQLADR
jgi:bifunctional non-homologous end joining protein LigD